MIETDYSERQIQTGLREVMSLITNPNVFTEDYKPQDILFRQEEIKKLLLNTFNPIVSWGKGENVLIWGESGLGKTLMVKALLDQLTTYAKEKGMPYIVPIYINCGEHKTAFQVMSHLASTILNQTFDKVRGKMISEYWEMVYKHMGKLGCNYLIVLDEIDKIKIKEEINSILYLLSRAKESGNIGDSNITLICMYNDVNFRKYLDQSVKSSLREYSIVINPYTIEQILGILNQRTVEGLTKNSIDEGLLKFIAKTVYREESSDVRKAIQILLKAVKICADENKQNVDVEHINKAILDLGKAELNDYLIGMNDEKLITLKSLCILNTDRKQITSQYVFWIYTSMMLDVFQKPLTAKSLKQIQRYLDEIDSTKLINKRGTRNGNFYTVPTSFDMINEAVDNNLLLRGLKVPKLQIVEEETKEGFEMRVIAIDEDE